MKLFREALIVFGIYLIGEFISSALSLPIPGNILGMIILFILLYTNTIKVENIVNITDFLLNHLAFFFIPAGVGLMTSIGIIKDSWIQLLLVCLLTTIIIIAITGIIVQFIVRKGERKNKGDDRVGSINK